VIVTSNCVKVSARLRTAFPGGGPFKAKKLKGYATYPPWDCLLAVGVPWWGPFKAKKLKGYALFVFGLPQQINLRADSPEHKKSRN